VVAAGEFGDGAVDGVELDGAVAVDGEVPVVVSDVGGQRVGVVSGGGECPVVRWPRRSGCALRRRNAAPAMSGRPHCHGHARTDRFTLERASRSAVILVIHYHRPR
jgi:hypothetical protein